MFGVTVDPCPRMVVLDASQPGGKSLMPRRHRPPCEPPAGFLTRGEADRILMRKIVDMCARPGDGAIAPADGGKAAPARP